MWECLNDLPACTASTLELCHVIVPRPYERDPVCDGNGVDGNCHSECTGEMTAMDITSDCATTGCLYVDRISRLVGRKGGLVFTFVSAFCSSIICNDTLCSIHSPIEYLEQHTVI